jgi:hypothetical protein
MCLRPSGRTSVTASIMNPVRPVDPQTRQTRHLVKRIAEPHQHPCAAHRSRACAGNDRPPRSSARCARSPDRSRAETRARSRCASGKVRAAARCPFRWTSDGGYRPGTRTTPKHTSNTTRMFVPKAGAVRVPWLDDAKALKTVMALPNVGAMIALPIRSAGNGSSPGYRETAPPVSGSPPPAIAADPMIPPQ